jgi:plasmid stability protein
MTLTINLSDEEAEVLQARAAAEGLSLEAWIQKLGRQDQNAERPLQTAADIVLSHMRQIPPEVVATMPADGASQHDHYIYGWPKRDV